MFGIDDDGPAIPPGLTRFTANALVAQPPQMAAPDSARNFTDLSTQALAPTISMVAAAAQTLTTTGAAGGNSSGDVMRAHASLPLSPPPATATTATNLRALPSRLASAAPFHGKIALTSLTTTAADLAAVGGPWKAQWSFESDSGDYGDGDGGGRNFGSGGDPLGASQLRQLLFFPSPTLEPAKPPPPARTPRPLMQPPSSPDRTRRVQMVATKMASFVAELSRSRPIPPLPVLPEFKPVSSWRPPVIFIAPVVSLPDEPRPMRPESPIYAPAPQFRTHAAAP